MRLTQAEPSSGRLQDREPVIGRRSSNPAPINEALRGVSNRRTGRTCRPSTAGKPRPGPAKSWKCSGRSATCSSASITGYSATYSFHNMEVVSHSGIVHCGGRQRASQALVGGLDARHGPSRDRRQPGSLAPSHPKGWPLGTHKWRLWRHQEMATSFLLRRRETGTLEGSTRACRHRR